ncbi:MAG: hypothetical protein L0214_06935 [candidate division NC10 bacterium]|nr:hypothetical protein [candidate division NC10 bacterium]
MDRYKLSDELKGRIGSLAPMSPDDWREALEVLTDRSREQAEIQASHHVALQVRVTYDLVNALHAMDRTSAALSRKLVLLTWVLVLFTAVLLVEPAVHLYHWLRG